MVSGRFFNRGVKTLDNPDIGYVVRETPDKIIVFGGKGNRYDIPLSEIQQVGANVLIGLPFSEVEKKYKVNRNDPLPTSRQDPWKDEKKQVDLAYYEGKYPKSLFNKGVRAENEDDLGFVAKETNDKIVVFGYSNDRYDIPKSEIIAVGMNVIIGKNFPEIAKYKVDRNAPLPTGEPIETIAEEAFPEDHHK
jgi:sporulation protein YlmC with PRC-barrel domain